LPISSPADIGIPCASSPSTPSKAEIAREVLSCAVESEHELPAVLHDFLERAGA
jgi:hypothetical protein